MSVKRTLSPRKLTGRITHAKLPEPIYIVHKFVMDKADGKSPKGIYPQVNRNVFQAFLCCACRINYKQMGKDFIGAGNMCFASEFYRINKKAFRK